ncbi:MAG: alpha-isopropylmalate synthase regulatory domain-containing protein [Acidobacteriota bacterium]
MPKAIKLISGAELTLKAYDVRSLLSGQEAQQEVSLEREYDGQILRGQARDRDIITEAITRSSMPSTQLPRARSPSPPRRSEAVS